MKYTEFIKQADVGTNTVPGRGTFADYYNEYMQQPHVRNAKLLNKTLLHLAPVWAGAVIGAGIGGSQQSQSPGSGMGIGASIGGGLGLLASLLLSGPINSNAEAIGQQDAWRYAAMRSAATPPNPAKSLV